MNSITHINYKLMQDRESGSENQRNVGTLQTGSAKEYTIPIQSFITRISCGLMQGVTAVAASVERTGRLPFEFHYPY